MKTRRPACFYTPAFFLVRVVRLERTISTSQTAARTRCYMCMNYIWRCLVRKTCSPALFSPLSPRPPEAVVVKHVVVWKCSHTNFGAGAFSAVSSFDLTELFCCICSHPLIPDLRFVIRLTAAHPAGAMDLPLCKATSRSVCPCLDILFSANTPENPLLAVNGAFALFTIVTAISVQL